LGLTIAAQLAALMDGNITVESEVGRGSMFSFTARFCVQAQQPAATIENLQELWNLRVLVVDDSAASRELLDRWLLGWGLAPRAVADAMSAMDELSQAAAAGNPYPLILLDARMPDVDGLTLAGEIRGRPDLSRSRIILLTSGHRPGDKTRFRDLQIDGRLVKPVQRHELALAIRSSLARPAGSEAATRRLHRIRKAQQSKSPTVFPLHILVAEDNELNAQLMKQLLSKRGHRVRIVDNGRETLNLANASTFDLLFLDLQMPELDGFEVIHALREREQISSAHLPVIAMTARSRKEDRERCLAAGMDEYLAKPVQANALWDAIDQVTAGWRRVGEPCADVLSPRVLLAACGNDDAILKSICGPLQSALPSLVITIRTLLESGDLQGLRASAHRLCGMVSAFSSIAGSVASDLEDCAARGELDQARGLVERTQSIVGELLATVRNGVTVESLRKQMGLQK
jgi:CheY-like chemotaxis protein